MVPNVLVYHLHSEEGAEEDDNEDNVPAFTEWQLPNRWGTPDQYWLNPIKKSAVGCRDGENVHARALADASMAYGNP